MPLVVELLHKNLHYLMECCNLINSEWPRSNTARLRSLESSCDDLPTNLILLKEKALIGHLKLSKIPSIKNACFVETVIISKALRGKGYGSVLMQKAEDYCKNCLQVKTIFLSTHGQEQFYKKLGYTVCAPVSIYGSFTLPYVNMASTRKVEDKIKVSGPPAPPMPNLVKTQNVKTFMKKDL